MKMHGLKAPRGARGLKSAESIRPWRPPSGTGYKPIVAGRAGGRRVSRASGRSGSRRGVR